MTKTSVVPASVVALLFAGAFSAPALAQGVGPCGGYGPGWMGQGQGMGPGMGPGMGQGFGPGQRQGYGWGMGRGPGMMGAAMPVDLDHDGVVVAEEAATHADQRFALLDLDGDDVVTEEEFMEATPPHRQMMGWGGGAQRMFRFRAERFKAFDADGNGEVSRAEFIGSAQAAFERADADGDGKVTVWEFRAERRPR